MKEVLRKQKLIQEAENKLEVIASTLHTQRENLPAAIGCETEATLRGDALAALEIGEGTREELEKAEAALSVAKAKADKVNTERGRGLALIKALERKEASMHEELARLKSEIKAALQDYLAERMEVLGIDYLKHGNALEVLLYELISLNNLHISIGGHSYCSFPHYKVFLPGLGMKRSPLPPGSLSAVRIDHSKEIAVRDQILQSFKMEGLDLAKILGK